MNRRVVVTGVGMISPAGNGKDIYIENCKKGESFVKKVTSFDTELFRSKYAGQVDFNAKGIVSKVIQRQCDPCTLYGFGATEFALKDAQIDLDKVNRERFGLMIGNAFGGCAYGEKEIYNLYNHGAYAISPYMMIAWFYAATIGQISIHYKLKGIGKTIVTDRASGADNIGNAYNSIKYGNADIMLAGGVEAPVNAFGFLCMDQTGETIDGDGMGYQTAYRPFSKTRQGYFPAEGAALVILEEMEHAKNRNAPIYGEIVGYALTNDGYNPHRLDPQAGQLTRAIKLVLEQAEITSNELDYINADGVGTRAADLRETRGIKGALEENYKDVLVSAPKSMYGFSIAAAGSFDFIETAISVKENLILPTINYFEPDPECDLNIVAHKPLKKDVNYALTVSCGFGGVNSALLLKKVE